MGALLRYGASGLAHRIFGTGFPWGTLGVNLVGSFFIGFLYPFTESFEISPNIRLMIFIGLLGAFTTFSTFSLESVNLIRDRQFHLAAVNIIVSCIFGLALVIVGLFASRFVLSLFQGAGK